MDAITPVNAAPLVQAPLPTADVRPTADTAAIVRDPQPDLPMPFPASMGQAAEVNQSRLSVGASFGQVEEIERVLKPYNVTMLPHDPGENGKDDDVKADEDTALALEKDTEDDVETPVVTTTEAEPSATNDKTTETSA